MSRPTRACELKLSHPSDHARTPQTSRPTRACELKFFSDAILALPILSRPTRACELKWMKYLRKKLPFSSRPTRACELKFNQDIEQEENETGHALHGRVS